MADAGRSDLRRFSLRELARPAAVESGATAVPFDIAGARRCDQQSVVAAGAEPVYRAGADRVDRGQRVAQSALAPIPTVHISAGDRDQRLWGLQRAAGTARAAD